MKKVLVVGFTSVQLELARKFLVFRGLANDIQLLPEQQSSTAVDGYVVNGDDASAGSRLALYFRLNAKPVLGIGSRPTAGVTTFVAGAFKPATVDRLKELLDGRVAAPQPAVQQPGNVLAFPGATAAPEAEVLVVDDSDLVRRTMIRKINQYGQRVDVAGNGDDAMGLLMNGHYRLVFLDVMMPGMDGLEVCRRIKRSPEYRAAAVYMLTSKDGMFDKVRGSMAGCDGYLVKPLEGRKLREVLDKYFERPSLMGDSDLIGSNVGTADLNEAERQAIEGSPPPEAVAPAPVLEPRDLVERSFDATVPAPLGKH